MIIHKYIVVIPCFNEEDTIASTLDSLLKQTILPTEIIVVNDGSTDNTPTILTEYEQKSTLLRIVDKKNKIEERQPGSKVIKAFYEGYKTIQEEYQVIAKLDADIILPHDYYEKLLTVFSNNKEIGMAGGILQIQNKDGYWVDEGLVDKDHLRGAIKTYTKACFDKIGGMKQTIGWDTIDVILAQHYGFKTVVDSKLKVKLLYPTGERYQSEHARKLGEGMYKIRYGFIITLISAFKASWKRKNGTYLFTVILGFLSSYRKKKAFSVTQEEGLIIRSYRKKKMLTKLNRFFGK